jgi:hypothetical protein
VTAELSVGITSPSHSLSHSLSFFFGNTSTAFDINTGAYCRIVVREPPKISVSGGGKSAQVGIQGKELRDGFLGGFLADTFNYWSFAYSALASFRMGMSASASFQRAKKS